MTTKIYPGRDKLAGKQEQLWPDRFEEEAFWFVLNTKENTCCGHDQ